MITVYLTALGIVFVIISILLINIAQKRSIIVQQTATLQEAHEQTTSANKTVEYERMNYKLVIESMNIALWEMEYSPSAEEGSIGEVSAWIWSQEFRNMLGYKDESEFPNTFDSFREHIHPDELERTKAAFEAHVMDRSGKTPYKIEYRLRHKNGEYLYFDGFGTTLRDSKGYPIRVSGAIRNITDIKGASEALKKREEMLDALNKTAIMFLAQNKETFDEMMASGVGRLADLFNIDRFSLFCNFTTPDGLHASQIYRWDREVGGTTPPNKMYADVTYSSFAPTWKGILEKDDVVNGPARLMAEREAATLKAAGVISAFVVPVFTDGAFWGFALFEDRHNERYFDDNCVEIMRSTAFLCANTVIRNEMERDREKLTKDIYNRDHLLDAVNLAASILLTIKDAKDFQSSLLKGMEIIGRSVEADCVEIWKNEMIDGELYAVINNYWFNNRSPHPEPAAAFKSFSYKSTPDWEKRLSSGECIKGSLENLSLEDREFINSFGIKSLLVIPIFMEDHLWGMCCIDDYSTFRDFTDDEVGILRSCALFFVNALLRNGMDLEIRETSAELMLRKNTLQTIIDSIPDIIFCKYLDFRYSMLNSVCLEFLGSDMENIIGKSDFELGFPDNVANKMIWADTRILDGEQKVVYDDWVPPISGDERYLETTKAPLVQDGAIVGIVGISRDITEKMQMEKTLSAALEQANAASKAKSNFLSTMSHEMRTPMNAIIGMTSIGKKANNIEGKDYALTKIGNASSHLLGVINDVLDMAKIEAAKLELVPVEFNFERLLQRVIAVINLRIDEKRQKLSVNIDSKIPEFLVADDQRLAQVMTNLLSNAVKFTPEGGEIRLEASLLCESDDDCELRIDVVDNGIGIDPKQHEKLFAMFEQAESGISREYGGTGLGLGISKNIIELMGGKIWIESEIGKGARFIFTIKTKRGEKNYRSLLSPGVNWDNIRILAVDDVKEVLYQFEDIFDNLDIKCDVASNGIEACQLIEERGEYDIYFVDWRMPDMDGIELTKKIKTRASDRQSVVIMITAMDWEQIRESAADAGVAKHLLKPLSPSMVIDCVNDCLGVPSIHLNTGKIEGIFAGKKMLLAEDVEINREILITLLEDTGISIDSAENGREAIEAIEAAPDKYDIIFMDVQMPKMDGLEATRRIRALPSLRKLPIIAMTANVFKDDIEECLKAGMDDHLGKPLDVDKVLEILRKYLEI